MIDVLAKSRIFFDEIDKICILDPEIRQLTNDLKDECMIFSQKIHEFQRLADKYITLLEGLAEEIEKQKVLAIGARNILQNMSKQQENQQQQLLAVIWEKNMELERLKIHLKSLQGTVMDQNETIAQLIQC